MKAKLSTLLLIGGTLWMIPQAHGTTVVNSWTVARQTACRNPRQFGCINSDWYHGGGYYIIDRNRTVAPPRKAHKRRQY